MYIHKSFIMKLLTILIILVATVFFLAPSDTDAAKGPLVTHKVQRSVRDLNAVSFVVFL